MSLAFPPEIEVPAEHLIQSEINAVTSAIRKHVRNASSSSFLGGSSNAAGIGPVAGGSSSASLLRSAVLAASASSHHYQDQGVNGTVSSPLSALTGGAPTLRVAHGERMREERGHNMRSNSTRAGASSYNNHNEGRRDEEIPSLLNGFTVLRAQLREAPNIDTFLLTKLLSPFLRVILSPRTTGPITSIALQAVHRLIIYQVVKAPSNSDDQDEARPHRRTDSTAFQACVAEIAHAVSHCRFEASEAVADELVLLRILAVMKELICGDGILDVGLSKVDGSLIQPRATLANCLGDESICEMMETGLSMCCQMRLSDLLRRTAEQSMTTMVRALFSRLSSIPTEADEAYSADPNIPEVEPEHATLAAEPVGEDAIELDKEKKLRRMTMPDPKSRDIPAAADNSMLQQLKEMGEEEEGKEKAELYGIGVESPRPKHDGEEEGQKSAGEDINEKSTLDVSADHELVAESAESGIAREGSEELPEEASFPISEVRPFGLPAIKEVLRVIVSLLDPHNLQHTDAMRSLGLSMLCSVFEVAGRSIGRFPSLRVIIQDSACKYLFQLARSDKSTILTYSLRTFSTLFETMREHLKLQYELFLNFLLDRLSPTFPLALEPWKDEASNLLAMQRANLMDSRGVRRSDTPETPAAPPPPPMPRSSDRAPAHGETREMMLETLGLLLGAYQPNRYNNDSMLELWINYDCDVDCDNLFEKVIHFLCRAVYATNPLHPDIHESSQLFAVDILLNFLSSMTARQEAEAMGLRIEYEWPEALSSAESLAAQKGFKASILDGAARFNAKPKDGLAYLEKQGFINTSGQDGVSKEVSIAKFLKDSPRLDKKLVGDFISRPDKIDILHAFLGLFDFTNKPIAEAMREMLETFRLPGESQQINRITETFAKIYFATHPADVKSEDAVYVLSYSVIMLNTDLHNPQNKRRMTVEDYRRNLRGVNDNSDFDEAYLGSIYDSIRRREIVMPEEHVGQLGFEYTWKELLRKSRKSGQLLSAITTKFDQAMFDVSWRPIMASIAQAFRTHKDEHLLEREISGFRHCAILASRFGMIELFDSMCQGLANATQLLDASGAGAVTNNAFVEVEGHSITVSPLSIQFGGNFKGQLAAVVLFTIANGNGNAIRKGWKPIFEIFKNLYINSLLPLNIGLMFEFGSTEAKSIPLKPKKAPATIQDARSQAAGGLLSTISSYLLSPYSVEKEVVTPEVSEEEIESSLCTADCVASCRIEDLFAQILELKTEALVPALTTLVELANKSTVDRRNATAVEGESASSGRSTPVQGASGATSTPNTSQTPQYRGGQPLPYDPSAAFLLELATTIACSADSSTLPEAYNLLYEHFQTLLSTPLLFHSLQVERAAVTLLRLVHRASSVTVLRDQLFIALDQLTPIPNEYKTVLAPQVTAGLLQILRDDASFVQSQTEWSLILSLLTTYSNVRNASAATQGFHAVVFIAKERVSEENFVGVVNALRDFARGSDFHLNNRNDQSTRRTLTEKKEQKEFEDACRARGPLSVETLDLMKVHIPRLSRMLQLSTSQTWTKFWRPLMTSIAMQYTNTHRETRQSAITHLQRILLTPELHANDPAVGTSSSAEDRWVLEDLFNSILFPTLNELLKPEVFQRDPSNESGSMQETRIRACNLLCKVFLHYLTRLGVKDAVEEAGQRREDQGAEVDESFVNLWLNILDFFDRFMHSGKKDQLSESTPENLKNVLLVMNASGLLLPPPPPPPPPPASLPPSDDAHGKESNGDNVIAPANRSQTQVELFDKTFERIQRFLPHLKDELFQ
ncbi:hypothetical protein CBS101457_006521 [Exobasidium rhododendri]|nr:hypothetical protein CBS101457_006521 [Exobasidium rhododendri]